MPIIDTESTIRKYLASSEDDPTLAQGLSIIEPILSYFPNAKQEEIQILLLSHGLFSPEKGDSVTVLQWLKMIKNIDFLTFFSNLKTKWNGPDIPIFILPSNEENEILQRDFYGYSGVSFHDKCFLFIPLKYEHKRMKALFTHEYHHVCRLHLLHPLETNLSLLDSIILEGTAEYTVRKLYGDSYGNKNIKTLGDEDLLSLYQKWIQPYQNHASTELIAHQLMYGGKQVPLLLGYKIGYSLVCKYRPTTIEKLIATPTQEFFQNLSS